MAARKTKPSTPDIAKEQSLPFPDILGLEMRAEAREIAEETLMETSSVVKTYDDTVRWPIWRSAVLVISLCLGFWICAASLLMYALS